MKDDHKNINTPNGKYNPFVKKGDIIMLKGLAARYRVIEVDEEKLKTIPEAAKDLSKIITSAWNEFAGWRSK